MPARGAETGFGQPGFELGAIEAHPAVAHLSAEHINIMRLEIDQEQDAAGAKDAADFLECQGGFHDVVKHQQHQGDVERGRIDRQMLDGALTQIDVGEFLILHTDAGGPCR